MGEVASQFPRCAQVSSLAALRMTVPKDSPPGQEGWIQTERSECLETGWWIAASQGSCHPERKE